MTTKPENATLNNADSLAQMCVNFLLSQDRVSQYLGIKLVSVASGNVTVSMDVTATMLNGHKTCHGGLLFSLADSAFAFACNSQNQAAVAAACH